MSTLAIDWSQAAPLEDFLQRRRAEQAVEEARKAARMTVLPPLIPCRAAEPHETPPSAQRAAQAAAEAFWLVRVTYARGWLLSTRQDPREADSIAVRCSRGRQHMVGVWLDGSYSLGIDERLRRYAFARSPVMRGGKPIEREAGWRQLPLFIDTLRDRPFNE